ncbi:dihydrolipoyl dehydrogenase [Anaerocolumna xylanovorans]|uniref:Dihydrolipoyl dehydrogenase n=1 Tax=Anaerocolumna xylanovorans DSM 12503 TaxID=1121345 RepID=A0A1M7Y0N2_9FIRM|nr:dihydrolipoyl dehydrogenase [Anaerocolumna xylanovorans]SHO44926.1 dihydrolipoamide dehydrogenase [Anaerocolumna xylanovorans DSM 12503]
MDVKYQLIVIGAGPGGYEAAIRAAQLGLKTAIVEEGELGGTCLNKGCIPTKTLLHSSNLYYETKNFEELGLTIPEVSYDLGKIYERKDRIVEKIRSGIGSLLEANKIDVFHARAVVEGAGQVKLYFKENGEERYLGGENLLLATGSKPFLPQVQGIELPGVMTSDEILEGKCEFNKLVIVGGGVIGCEFATIFGQFGTSVEIVEAADRILPSLEKELSRSASMNLKKKGVIIHTKTRLEKIEESVSDGKRELKISASAGGDIKELMAEAVLVCIGRKSNTDHLFAEGVRLELDRGRIKTNERFMTEVPGIYAIGDVTGGILLAHNASAQGIAAAEYIGQGRSVVNLDTIPSCVYMNPEIASVGLSEEEAREKGYEVVAGKYPMAGNCKTVLSMDERSYIKVVAEKETGKLLGAQMICARATDMIGEFSLAIANGLTVEEMHCAVRPHPTYEEGITEALADILTGAIHLMPKK